jgi:CRP/FNR family cyclic AMP-dependent transcriptional regulator
VSAALSPTPAENSWITGVLALAGTEIPISGRVHRVQGSKVTIELDLLIEEFAATLEGYLTRAQLLDVLV